MEPTDLELIRSAGDGDDAAFHVLVDRHARDLYRVARGLSRSRADAEDLVQETFVGAFRGLKRFEGRASVRTWLVQILSRQAAKAWHKSRYQRSTRSIHPASPDDRTEDSALCIEGAAPAVDRKLDVARVLEQIKPEHREVLVLREIRGMSYQEIADALGVPRGTIESRLFRARAEFRERLNGSTL